MPVIQNEVGLTLDRIVVATDFTAESEKALDYARIVAQRYASRVTLAHVIDRSVASVSPNAVVGRSLDEMRHDDAENMERTLRSLGEDGITAQTKTLEGHDPADAVVELANSLDADLLVVGTHSRRGLFKIIIGSCSQDIARSAKCPVMIIGPNVKSKPADLNFRSIVFATDLQHNALEKAVTALTFAKDSISDIHICHVIEDHPQYFPELARKHACAERALSQLIPEADYTWCTPKPSVLFGDVDQEILRVARSKRADLIVLGAHRGFKCFNRFWQSTVEQIVSQAACPVLTICTD